MRPFQVAVSFLSLSACADDTYSHRRMPDWDCPSQSERYEPTGADAEGISDCADDECLFCCSDGDLCTTRGSVTCEPCEAVEAFMAGPCVDCELTDQTGECRRVNRRGRAYDPICYPG
jgi:hypothetical protein